jgi:hypothetical protein
MVEIYVLEMCQVWEDKECVQNVDGETSWVRLSGKTEKETGVRD